MKCFISLFISVLVIKTGIAQDSSFYFTTSDSVKLFVHIAGRGKPCLFLHGGPGLTSKYFEECPAARLIEQELRMVYFDQRGSGRSSSAKNGNYSMKRMELDAEELRSFLKIKKWLVMGHSFGGLIMTAYARDYPGIVQALIYANCTLDMKLALHSHIDNGLILLREAGDTMRVNTQLAPFDQMNQVHAELAKKGIEYKIMYSTLEQSHFNDSVVGSATPHFNQDFSHRFWARKDVSIPDYAISYAPYTKAIACPVLVISGKKDFAVGPDSYKQWHFKNKIVLLSEGGHDSFLEEPEWFARAVLDFVKSMRYEKESPNAKG